MRHQPSTLARNLSSKPRVLPKIQEGVSTETNQHLTVDEVCITVSHTDNSRTYFVRTALFTALATSLVGFGIAPAVAADNNNPNNTNLNSTDLNSTDLNNSPAIFDSDAQLDIALDALRLKKAVEQGIIEQSVLDEYSEQNLGTKPKKKPTTQQNIGNNPNSLDSLNDLDNLNGLDSSTSTQPSISNEYLQQQAATVPMLKTKSKVE